MRIIYSSHLKIRLKERKIPQNYPKEILKDPEKEYFDAITGYRISIKKMHYAGKEKNMVIAYDIIRNRIEIITVHPISDSEINNKAKAGRWKNYEKN